MPGCRDQLCECVCVRACTRIQRPMDVCACICVVSKSSYVSVWLHGHVCTGVWTCVCMHVWLQRAAMCMWVLAHICTGMWTCVHACVCGCRKQLCECVGCLHTYTQACGCVYMHVYGCMHMYAQACGHVCACMCVWLQRAAMCMRGVLAHIYTGM